MAPDWRPEQRYWQNRETANIGGLDSSGGRTPARKTRGHWFKSRSTQCFFVQPQRKNFLPLIYSDWRLPRSRDPPWWSPSHCRGDSCSPTCPCTSPPAVSPPWSRNHDDSRSATPRWRDCPHCCGRSRDRALCHPGNSPGRCHRWSIFKEWHNIWYISGHDFTKTYISPGSERCSNADPNFWIKHMESLTSETVRSNWTRRKLKDRLLQSFKNCRAYCFRWRLSWAKPNANYMLMYGN